jgi:hypothetical protein
MMPARRSIRVLANALLLASAALSLSTCSGTGTDYSGGGTGGTGISTGSISGFGSVVVNGVHYRTDAKTKKSLNGVPDNSGRIDNNIFAVGMIVTVRHGAGDNNAQEIEYRDNLRGPIAVTPSGADNIIILGHTVVSDDNTVFDGTTFASLRRDDVVEVSGFADNAGRIRASYIFAVPPPTPPPVQEFEAKGYVSGLSDNTFRLGTLPNGLGMTVAVSYDAAAMAGLPGELGNGMFVQVTTANSVPVAGSITATRIERLASRTDFPENAPVDFEGLVTKPWTGSGNDLSFEVEGKRVMWTADTVFAGGMQSNTRESNRKVQVQGTETGGVLSAINIIFR